MAFTKLREGREGRIMPRLFSRIRRRIRFELLAKAIPFADMLRQFRFPRLKAPVPSAVSESAEDSPLLPPSPSLKALPIVALNRTTGASVPGRPLTFKTVFVNGVSCHFLTQSRRPNLKLEALRIRRTAAQHPKPQHRTRPARSPPDPPKARQLASRSSAKNRSGRNREERRRFLQVQKLRAVHAAPSRV
ncbi:MAG UNVERIFIED_CONTAM: hypothetical protein LVR18_02020 [Planctomycetaceae bacterium]|jgi:hypothetical protein